MARAGLVAVKVLRRDGVTQTYWVRPDEVDAFVNKRAAQGYAVVSVEGIAQAGQGTQLPVGALALQPQPSHTEQDSIPEELRGRHKKARKALKRLYEPMDEATAVLQRVLEIAEMNRLRFRQPIKISHKRQGGSHAS